ncbi:MAG: sulfatase [Flaviaesturariibacter sp.]|nr:sulfatase [Flaviaesturariibacter sp.]
MRPTALRLKNFLSVYGCWLLATLISVFLFRFLEHAIFSSQLTIEEGGASPLILGLLNDALTVLCFGVIVLFPTFLFWILKPAAASFFFGLIGTLFLILHATLVRYYLTTKTLLGADLFGYSVADIRTTVTSSASFALTDLIPVLLLVLLPFSLWLIRKRSFRIPLSFTAVLLIIGIAGFFTANRVHGQTGTAAEALSLNKSAFFVKSNLHKTSFTSEKITFEGYPLMRPDGSTDALTPFFNLGSEKPNIVFLIIEGLGRDFTGPNAQYGGFTPYLDSLARHSLQWTNFLSSAGRSFAGLPSIFGSLPYSQKGFNELGQNMPDHLSLIRLLKTNGYRSTFFYGGNANFDHQDVFLERQGIDFILDENKFGAGYSRDFGTKYSWGFGDGDVYKRSLEMLSTQKAQPLLNIYFTLSTHEPFAIPNEASYSKLVDAKLAQLPSGDKARYAPYKEVWKALRYCDESIRSFIKGYEKRADYANTIFIITGDHRLIPVQERNAISRFHVPLLIYSPLLKRPSTFKALSSHLDITPSLVQLLRHYPDMQFPAAISWMGKGLDTGSFFNPAYEMPLMRNKNMLMDYMEGDRFLSGDQVYRLQDGLTLEPLSNNQLKEKMLTKLDHFRQLNVYLCSENKIYIEEGGASERNKSLSAFTSEEEKRLALLSGGSNAPDTLFMKARNLAASDQYNDTRLLCRKILMESPNYHGVRVLLGRTYLWEHKYAASVPYFKEVLRREPTFEDAYLAWIDAEIWSGNKDSALLLVTNALIALPQSDSIKKRGERALATRR